MKYLSLQSTHMSHQGDMKEDYVGANYIFPVFSCLP